MVVNGLNPESNRQVLELSRQYSSVWPALGIYPIDAINHLAQNLPFPVQTFDVREEISWIESLAKSGQIKAIGECGLDGYWVQENTFAEQEKVFIDLMEIAQKYDLPIIIHTRKREKRAMEILAHHKMERVNFHCYGGKTKLAIKASHDFGWWFSIPCTAPSNQAFTKLLGELPEDKILTETDAPYLSPVKGDRNEPANIVQTVKYLATIKGWTIDQARDQIWNNFNRLMRPHPQ